MKKIEGKIFNINKTGFGKAELPMLERRLETVKADYDKELEDGAALREMYLKIEESAKRNPGMWQVQTYKLFAVEAAQVAE